MNYMFISDIHGVKTNLEKIKKIYKEQKCNKLVVLGDLYYIGPRNRMQEGYDINYVSEFLHSFGDDLICVRGNCDSDVDLMVNKFPTVSELGLILYKNKEIYITHGHIYNENNWDKENTILIYGHLHTPFIKEKDNKIFVNPGSISLPKDENGPSYLILKNDNFTVYNIKNDIIFEKKLDFSAEL